MFIKIQEHLKPRLREVLKTFDSHLAFYEVLESDDNRAGSGVLIGDLDFLQSQPAQNDITAKILFFSKPHLQPALLRELSQDVAFFTVCAAAENSEQQLTTALHEIRAKAGKDAQVIAVKAEIQRKRKELELLNAQLSSESEKKIESLEKSHLEETEKNLNEKNMLHFLDFIQTESARDDFIEKLFRFIWKDFKKIGRLYQLGLSTATHTGKSKLFYFDGTSEHSTLAQVDFSAGKVSNQLAVAWGRPVGKVMTWPLPKSSKEAYLFLEIVDQQMPVEKVSAYFNERIPVLSIYFDRWIIEKEIEVIVDRWENTFRSFSGYTHVIDENFEIYQANYPHASGDFCYKVLANRTEPCESCPVLKNKNTSFVLRDDISVKTYFSQFRLQDKRYFFVIYEDVTKLNQLHSHIIQTEKMSTLGRLGNHLAHELNNPLTGIKSYVQTILSDPGIETGLPATARSDLSEILKAAVRCQKIIKNFIDFSQKKEPSLEVLTFSEVVQNTIVLLKTALRSHRVFIDLQEDRIRANSHDLQQVLFNLIKNSCQAMPQAGSIKIYQEVKGEKVYFHIEDSGEGFSESIMKNIFQPFMTTKMQGEGTGLGLYLSKKLMNNMNADLQVGAAGKKGAKITLIFDRV